MVAGLLRLLGVDLGADIDPDTNEDREFLGHGGDRRLFLDPSFLDAKLRYLHTIKSHIARRNACATWGWKDPLAAYYIEEVLRDLRNPGFVFVSRDPVAIAVRERFEEPSRGPGAELAYVLTAAEETRRIANFLTGHSGRSLLVSYERALRHPRRLVTDLMDFLDVRRAESEIDAAVAYVLPERGTGKIANPTLNSKS